MTAINGKYLNSAIQPPMESTSWNPRFWTDAKVERAWNSTFSGILATGAVVTGVLGFTSSPAFFLLAFPLLFAAAGLVWYTSRLIDYDNPEELALVREQSKMMPLSQIGSKHGWEKVFRYAILSTEDLKAKFDAEWCHRNASEIVGQFEKHLHYFLTHRLVSKEEYALLLRAAAEYQKSRDTIAIARSEYTENVRQYDGMYSVGNHYLWSKEIDRLASSPERREQKKNERYKLELLHGLGNLAYDVAVFPHKQKLSLKIDEALLERNLKLNQIDQEYTETT